MVEPVETSPTRRLTPATVALFGALALCWILLTPPGASPDEPTHLVRAGQIADGRFFDELLATSLDPSPANVDVPDEFVVPMPDCYAFQPQVPVDCAVGTRPDPPWTTATNYPVWGHVAPALAGALPGDGGVWAARIASAAIAVTLVGAAFVAAARRSVTAAAGVLVALTPMVWGTFAVVNPSAVATAGAVAVWTALLLRQPGWLLAAGWTALVLPRRDGLMWACLILAAVVLVYGREVLAEIWRVKGPLVLAGASTAMALVWSVTNAARVAQLGALAPGAVVAAWGIRLLWDRWAGRPAQRAALAATVAVVGAAGVAATFVKRPGGWNADLAEGVVRATRKHLTQAIGVLGWLDAPLPRWSVVGWVVLVAALGVLVVRARVWQALALAGGVLGLAIVTAWMFELQEGSTYADYWQGRYSLPLLTGVPIALGAATRLDRRLMVAIGGAALALLNVAAWAVTRRWAVGVNGTHRPWNWGAEMMPVHPVFVLALHALASLALVAMLATDAHRSAPGVRNPPVATV